MNLGTDNVRDSIPLFRNGSGGSIPTSVHQLTIVKCKPQLACKLNALWHSRLPEINWSNVVRNKRYVCFSAEYDFISYANRFKNGNQMLELRRLAISPEAPTNTASRMLKIMKNIIKKEFSEINRLISYQDTQVHKGTIYKASGWNAIHKTRGTSWTTKKRTRSKEQSLADKVRWEYDLNDRRRDSR